MPDEFRGPSPNGAAAFRTTQWSVVVNAGSDNSKIALAALEELCRRYWYPLYAYIRRSGYSHDDAGQNNEAKVRAETGDLGVRVSASSAAFTSGATAFGIAKFSDDLKVTSATLPFGSPVNIVFTMELDGVTSFTGGPSPAGGLDTVITLIGQVGSSHIYKEIHEFGEASTITGSKTFTVNSTVGATLTLVGTLDINVRSDFQSLANSALSDYLSSAKFFATPGNLNVSLLSVSGHDYSIPTPDGGPSSGRRGTAGPQGDEEGFSKAPSSLPKSRADGRAGRTECRASVAEFA